MQFRQIAPLGLVLAPFFALQACESPQVGSRTHWLVECESDGECGSELSCLCGICSATCEDSTDCGEGLCASLTAVSARCGGDSPGRMCLEEEEASCEEPLSGTGRMGGAGGQSSECGGDGVLLCESFESAELPDHYNVFVSEGGELSQQSCVVAEGEGAASSSESWASIQIPVPGPVADGPFHARVRMYWPSGTSDSFSAGIMTLRSDNDFVPGQLSVRLDGTGALRLDGGPGFGDPATAPGTIERDRWYCIEMAGSLPSAGATMTMSIDGEVVVTREDTPEGAITEPFSVAMLFHAEDGAAEAEIVLDDFVLSREPIGCD